MVAPSAIMASTSKPRKKTAANDKIRLGFIGLGQQANYLLSSFIQMEDVRFLHPNDTTDPDFGRALREAAQAGVVVLAMDCRVTPQSMELQRAVPVKL